MKEKKSIKAFLIFAFMLAAMLCVFVACSEDPKSVYSFEGIEDIHLSQSATEYDFSEGVTGFKDLKEAEFQVDASAVKFGTAGKYEITYSIENYKQTANVYIYGMPEFTVTSSTITYAEAQTESGLKSGVTAKDTFGNALEIKVTQKIAAGAGGYIEYGNHTVKYTATDKVGNTKEYEREVTVSDADKPQYEEFAIDLLDIDVSKNLGNVELISIKFDNEPMQAGEYTFAGGYLAFSSEFVLQQELGKHTVFLATSAGYGEMVWNLTDAQPADFAIDVSDMGYSNQLSIPKAQLLSNQRNITFEYVLKDGQGKVCGLTDDGETLSFIPGLGTDFTLTVNAKRGTESAGSEEFDFKVYDDVYAWVTNANEKKNNVFVKPDYLGAYSEEQAYEGDKGSYYIKNQTEQDRGNVAINLKSTGLVPAGSTFVIYVYNPTGVELDSYIYTNSGYWIPPRVEVAGILSGVAKVPAEKGWHKVEITLVPGFDGNFVNMTSETANSAETQIRFTTSDWKWSGEGDFGIYVSNIYLKQDHTTTTVIYDENGFTENGLVGAELVLPKIAQQDGRIHAEYALETKDGTPVEEGWNAAEFKFVAKEEGEYVYRITSYWRDTEIETKEYTIQVAGSVTLPVEKSYEYNFETGEVVLPEALVAEALQGKTVRYSIQASGGEKQVLGQDRKYTCTKIGDYTYSAEVLDTDGTSVLDSTSATIRLVPSNVLIGFGQDAASVNGVDMGMGTTFTYTDAKAYNGELGSVLVDNTNQTMGEKGNFNLQMGATNIANVDQIVFWIYVPANVQLGFNVYSATSWIYSNYWYNGQQYTGDTVYPVQGKAEWQKIEFNIQENVSGADIRLNIITDSNQGYPWEEGQPAQIYISNIYYKVF